MRAGRGKPRSGVKSGELSGAYMGRWVYRKRNHVNFCNDRKTPDTNEPLGSYRPAVGEHRAAAPAEIDAWWTSMEGSSDDDKRDALDRQFRQPLAGAPRAVWTMAE